MFNQYNRPLMEYSNCTSGHSIVLTIIDGPNPSHCNHVISQRLAVYSAHLSTYCSRRQVVWREVTDD